MLRKLIPKEKIKARVKEMAREICREYQGRIIHTLCILNGAKYFHRDLVAELELLGKDVSCQEIRISSYNGTTSTGKVRIMGEIDVKGKDILIVEDIVDTGHSMKRLIPELKLRGARRARICTFLNKPSRRVEEVKLDFVGMDVSDLFVVGYGMDHDGNYRELPDIYFCNDPIR